MKQVCFVTFHGASKLTEDDRLAIAPLAELGYRVDPQVWNDPAVNWQQYHCIVLRSTWDYHKNPQEFSTWLSRLGALRVPLWNPPGLLRWNMDKTYLRDLSTRAIDITPTEWLDRGATPRLDALLRRNGWDRAVIKPALSATAFRTYVTSPDRARDHQPTLDEMLESGTVLVQKYEDSIRRGEWSMVFFQGTFSHSVLKVPLEGDFRVQKEYGGTSRGLQAPSRVLSAAEKVLKEIGDPWLYARVDLIDSPSGVRLMELEMLEPDLFLRHHSEAPDRFAKAIDFRVRQGEAG